MKAIGTHIRRGYFCRFYWVMVTCGAFILPILSIRAAESTAVSTPTSAPLISAAGGAAHSHSPAGGQLPAAVPLKIKLPFPAGARYQLIQGNHGDFTHSGFNSYAFDFGLPENSPVCAAASGRVVRVKQDGASGGASNEYFSQGNTIILDHGDGYYTQYLHLAQNSARVGEGDLVYAGQVIALSGNTGFSSMPHLHFQVQDASGRSLPARFQDVPGGGIPATDAFVTSGNNGRGASHYAGESLLPPDTFKTNSITLLTRGLPGHLYRCGHTYTFRGRLVGKTARQVAIYFMASTGGKPLDSVLAQVDSAGFFEAELTPRQLPCAAWSNVRSQSNIFSLAIAPVENDGSYWSETSIPVCIR